MNEELKVIITAEIAKLKKELEKGKKELGDFGKEGEKSTDKVNSGFSKVTTALGVAGFAIGAAIGVVAQMGQAMFDLAKNTEEYTRNQAKLTSAFETAGGSAEQATQTYNDLYRVLGDDGQTVEAANHLAMLTTDQQALAEWTTICQGAYATFGDSLPIESLTEAANESVKTGEATGALADALTWAGADLDEFNYQLALCNSESEREALIRDTLTGLYGDAAIAYEENAADILAANEAQAAWTDAMALLGEVVRPIITLFQGGLASALKELAPYLKDMADGFMAMADGSEGGIEKFQNAVEGITIKLTEFLMEALPDFINIGLELIGALILGVVQALPDMVMPIVEGATKLVDGFIRILPVLVEGILLAVMEVLEDLPTLLVGLLAYIPEILDILLTAVLDCLPTIIESVYDLIMGIVDELPAILISVIEAVVAFIAELCVMLVNSLPNIIAAVTKLVAGLLVAVVRLLEGVVVAVVGIFTGLWDSIVKVFNTAPDWFSKSFGKVNESIKKAFSSTGAYFSELWTKIKKPFLNVADWFSKTFSSAGTSIGDSVGKSVKAAVNGVLSTIANTVNGFIGTLNSAIGIINKIPGVNIPKVGTISIPKMATGGIVDSATLAMIGENGKEAVVPLENNTEWLDMLAERLVSALSGNNTPIILQVDGKTFGQVSVDSINAITRQRGSIPLRMR